MYGISQLIYLHFNNFLKYFLLFIKRAFRFKNVDTLIKHVLIKHAIIIINKLFNLKHAIP